MASADTEPSKWLLGKSIVLQYREARSFEPVETGRGRAHDDIVDFRAEIYVSDRGRVFAQAKSTVAPSTEAERSYTTLKSPDKTVEGYDWQFAGDTIYGFLRAGGDPNASAERITVQFNRNSQKCKVTIGYGRQGAGAPIIAGWYGENYYLRHYQMTTSTCDVKPGNVFDGSN